MTTIRVVIADDHDIVRRGLSVFLGGFDDLLLVGEAGTGRDAIRVCAEVQPDVILMDMMLPDMDGVAVTRAIRSQQPQVQVVMLTSSKDEALVQAALQAGAIGYMLKNISVLEMATTIRAAAAGKPMLSSEATQVLINMATQPRNPSRAYNLTSREQVILALLVQGLNNQAIADQLYVSRSTVKAYVSTILAKLGVSTRLDAVRLAVQQSLITTK